MIEQVPQALVAAIVGGLCVCVIAAILCAMRQKEQRVAYSFVACHALFVMIGVLLFMNETVTMLAISCWGIAMLSFVAALYIFTKQAQLTL